MSSTESTLPRTPLVLCGTRLLKAGALLILSAAALAAVDRGPAGNPRIERLIESRMLQALALSNDRRAAFLESFRNLRLVDREYEHSRQLLLEKMEKVNNVETQAPLLLAEEAALREQYRVRREAALQETFAHLSPPQRVRFLTTQARIESDIFEILQEMKTSSLPGPLR